MMNIIILSLIFISNITMAAVYESDIEAIKDISVLLEELDKNLSAFPQISCQEAGVEQTKKSINSPICSYQDICSAAKKEDGFINVNGVKVPDYQLHTKLTQLKNNVLNCYDQLDGPAKSYKELFSLAAKNSILPRLMPTHRFETFQQIYSRIDYREQLPKYFEHAITSTDLDTYLNSSDDTRIRDRNGNLLALSDRDLESLEALNNFLINPADKESKDILRSKLDSRRAQKRLDEYFRFNQTSERQKLLIELESKMNMRGFDYVDASLFSNLKDSEEVIYKKKKLIFKTNEIKKRMIEKVREQGMSSNQESYFIEKLKEANVRFMKPLEDGSCSAGTPAHSDRYDFVLCPKVLSLPDEAIDVIIGHELAHLVDHCTNNFFAENEVTVNGHMPPTLAESPFTDFNKCLKKNKTLDIRVKFDPGETTTAEAKKACSYHGENLDQTRETFSDIMSISTLESDIKSMNKATAQRHIVGLAFAKPFKCEENKDFNKSQYDGFIGDTSRTLDKAGCFNRIEPKKYAIGGPHLSMEDRVNHIFMTNDIQKALGCTSSQSGEKNYAQENLKCPL